MLEEDITKTVLCRFTQNLKCMNLEKCLQWHRGQCTMFVAWLCAALEVDYCGSVITLIGEHKLAGIYTEM